MSYDLRFASGARRDPRGLPAPILPRIRQAADALRDEPRPSGVRKMRKTGTCQIRVGQYRVVYDIDDEQQRVTILVVGHRSEVYRRGGRT